jgi:hypothetical protein
MILLAPHYFIQVVQAEAQDGQCMQRVAVVAQVSVVMADPMAATMQLLELPTGVAEVVVLAAAMVDLLALLVMVVQVL